MLGLFLGGGKKGLSGKETFLLILQPNMHLREMLFLCGILLICSGSEIIIIVFICDS